jgi:hypothetical protein
MIFSLIQLQEELRRATSLVGQRIQVWFDDEGRYSGGLVLQYNETSRKYTIKWDSGETTETELDWKDKTLDITNDSRWCLETELDEIEKGDDTTITNTNTNTNNTLLKQCETEIQKQNVINPINQRQHENSCDTSSIFHITATATTDCSNSQHVDKKQKLESGSSVATQTSADIHNN